MIREVRNAARNTIIRLGIANALVQDGELPTPSRALRRRQEQNARRAAKKSR